MLDTLVVVLVGLLGAVLSELFAWFFVYRTEDYQTLTADIRRIAKKYEQQKTLAPKSVKSLNKLKTQETDLAQKKQSLGWLRMKSGLFSSVFYFLVVPLFNNAYKGIVVARLPFQPMFFFRSLAHHGLTTFLETDCSSVYLYILSVGFFATNLQKFLSTTPPATTDSTNNPFSSWLPSTAAKS